MDNWIKVEDRLPDCGNKKYGVEVIGHMVTTYLDGSRRSYHTCFLQFSKGSFYYNYVCDAHRLPDGNAYQTRSVTHWMPKPKNPKQPKNPSPPTT